MTVPDVFFMTVYIVSGLPRSGTSLLMQMLQQGGMTLATDNKREPDENNPHGYYEIENIMSRLKDEPELISQFEGKVVKIICKGLESLPEHDYKIAYIQRELGEVLASMEKMDGKPVPDEQAAALKKLNERSKELISARDDCEVLFVEHKKIVSFDEDALIRLQKFFDLKGNFADAIDEDCYRNRDVKRDIKDSDADDDLAEKKLESLGYL